MIRQARNKPARNKPGRSTRSGFSLLEMLVAIALLGLLLGAVYSFTWNLFDRETRTLDEAAKSQAATMLFDRLETDLMSAIAATDAGAGLFGGSSSVTITHRSVLPGSTHAPDSDLQTTIIRFDERAQRVLVRRVDGTPPEQGALADIGSAERSGVSSDSGMIPVPIRMAKFRYHNGRQWSDRYTSVRGLPTAVEFAIWFGSDDFESDSAENFIGLETDFGTGSGGPSDFDMAGAARNQIMSGAEFDGEFAGEFGDGFNELPAPDRVRIVTIPDARLPRSILRNYSSQIGSIGGAP